MNTLQKIAIIFTVIFATVACDKIEPPYKVVGEVVVTTESRKVLLEDYTGHTCVNCPAAGKKAVELQQLYGDNLIVIGIHAGYFATPVNAPFDSDYRTDTGDAWDEFFGISAAGNPNGMINRLNNGGNYVMAPGDWGSQIASIYEDNASVKLLVETTYNEANRKLDIEVNTTFLQTLEGDYKLITVITEDSIVSAQRNNDLTIGPATILDYVHRHVLRESVSSTWGDVLPVKSGTAFAGLAYTNQYSLTLNLAYNFKHCSVVAFLYNTATYELVQVEEKHVKE